MLDAACSWWLGKLLWKEDTRWKWSLFVWWRIRIVYKIWLELSFPGWLENRYYRKCAFITNDTYKQYWKASHFYMEPHQYNRGEKGASFPPHTLVSLFPLISSLIFCPSSQIKSSDIFTSFFRLLLFWITWRRSGRWRNFAMTGLGSFEAPVLGPPILCGFSITGLMPKSLDSMVFNFSIQFSSESSGIM